MIHFVERVLPFFNFTIMNDIEKTIKQTLTDFKAGKITRQQCYTLIELGFKLKNTRVSIELN